METTHIDHTAYQARIRSYTEAELRYAMQDAREAMEAMPNGHKSGYYADEVHYCGMELQRRTRNI